MFDFGVELEPRLNKITDINLKCIAIDDKNDPEPENIPYEVPQPVNVYNWKSDAIILPRISNNLQHTYAAFKNYYCE